MMPPLAPPGHSASATRRRPLTGLVLGLLLGAAYACLRARGAGMVAGLGAAGRLDFVVLPLLAGALGALCAALLPLADRLLRGPERLLGGRGLVGVGLALGLLFVGQGFFTRAADPIRPLPAPPPAGAPRPPDVLLIILDAVRADALCGRGQPVPDWAPNLKALAAEGVIFDDAVAPAPWTLPAHASLFTGLSGLQHGASEEYPRLRPNMVTLAETLKERGYFTVGAVANPWLSRQRGFAQGFDRYFEFWKLRSARLPFLYTLTAPFEAAGLLRSADPRTDKGTRFMTTLGARAIRQVDRRVPLFLFMNLIDAHPPFLPPEPYRSRFVPAEARAKGVDPTRVSQRWTALLTGDVSLSSEEQATLRGLNRGEIAYMDDYLGRVVRALKAAGRYDNTLLAVTSDHGCGLGENRTLGAGFDLREEMLRIPMIVRFPGGAGAGTRRADLVCLQDLHPTILELVAEARGDTLRHFGASETDAAAGRSLLRGAPRSSSLAAFSRPLYMMKHLLDEYPEYDASAFDRRMLATRGPRWKLVWSSAERERLFDLSGAAERENVAARQPDTLAAEERRLDRMTGASPTEAWQRAIASAKSGDLQMLGNDPETLEMLRSLGYIQGTSSGKN